MVCEVQRMQICCHVCAGDSGAPVFSGNTIVGIHSAGACGGDEVPVGASTSYYLPVAAITAWVQATANTKCALSSQLLRTLRCCIVVTMQLWRCRKALDSHGEAAQVMRTAIKYLPMC